MCTLKITKDELEMEDKASRVLGVQEKEGCGIAASADAADVVNGPEKDRDKVRESERGREHEKKNVVSTVRS